MARIGIPGMQGAMKPILVFDCGIDAITQIVPMLNTPKIIRIVKYKTLLSKISSNANINVLLKPKNHSNNRMDEHEAILPVNLEGPFDLSWPLSSDGSIPSAGVNLESPSKKNFRCPQFCLHMRMYQRLVFLQHLIRFL